MIPQGKTDATLKVMLKLTSTVSALNEKLKLLIYPVKPVDVEEVGKELGRATFVLSFSNAAPLALKVKGILLSETAK